VLRKKKINKDPFQSVIDGLAATYLGLIIYEAVESILRDIEKEDMVRKFYFAS